MGRYAIGWYVIGWYAIDWYAVGPFRRLTFRHPVEDLIEMENLIQLGDRNARFLNEPNVAHTLSTRYEIDRIYT